MAGPPSVSPVPSQIPSKTDLEGVAARLNSVLGRYSDKDWVYSRIGLSVRGLAELRAPYVLWLEWFPTGTPEGRKALKSCEEEVTWGERHSAELGILEIVSLRLNRALLTVGAPEDFPDARPVVRLMKRAELERAGIRDAFWYEVTEVQGEEFDNR